MDRVGYISWYLQPAATMFMGGLEVIDEPISTINTVNACVSYL